MTSYTGKKYTPHNYVNGKAIRILFVVRKKKYISYYVYCNILAVGGFLFEKIFYEFDYEPLE